MGTLRVSSAPHLRAADDIPTIMRDVLLALLPASLAGVFFFGGHAFLVILVTVAAAVGTEYLIQRWTHRPVTIGDYSAAVTGLLLALVLPPTVPLWLPVVGAVVAIGIGKQVFGGLGFNPFNPALVGRAFLMASWPALMTTWRWPALGEGVLAGITNATTTATPLALWKLSHLKTPYLALFWGNVGGSLGETSFFALLLGALYLILRRRIDLRIPLAYLGTVALLAALFRQDPLFHLLAGGLALGAFFMATDYVTTPVTKRGRVVFGIGCGVLTVLIRLFGGYPEGVNYSILLMNAATPLIDHYTRPRVFGEVRGNA